MVDIVPNSQEIIGHGSFSIVYKARLRNVSFCYICWILLDWWPTISRNLWFLRKPNLCFFPETEMQHHFSVGLIGKSSRNAVKKAIYYVSIQWLRDEAWWPQPILYLFLELGEYPLTNALAILMTLEHSLVGLERNYKKCFIPQMTVCMYAVLVLNFLDSNL